MPNKYCRRSDRATSYSKNDLRVAIQKVRNQELSNYAASKLYGIPTSTLNDRVRGKTGIVSKTLGRPTAIPIDMESRLAQCLRTLEKWGWGLSRSEVLELVAEFLIKNNMKNPFKQNKPGADWFIAFRQRHNLSIKKPQPVEYLRKRMTDPFVINDYFKLLKDTLEDLKLDKPNRIWNLDETSVSLDPTKTKVVGGKGEPCTRTTAGTGKENITVLTTVNAAGEKLTPLIVFKGKYVYDQWMADPDSEYDFELAYAASKRGWMETEIFYNYMSKIVIPGLGEERPVLIIYDGHSTHVDDKVVALAVENNITILKLPPHTSHLLQPLDLAVFKSFKSIWDAKLVHWQRQNVGLKVRKKEFSKMFAAAWQQTTVTVIKNGFKKGGIYPFNSEVIPEVKYDPNALRRWQEHKAKRIVLQADTLKQLCTKFLNQIIICKKSESKNHTDNCMISIESGPRKSTFEELLLEKLTQRPRSAENNIALRMKRVAKGAEVITYKYLEKQKELQNSKIAPKARVVDNAAKPGSSGISQNKGQLEKTKPVTRKATMTDKTNLNTIGTTFKGKGIGKKTQNKKDKENAKINKHDEVNITASLSEEIDCFNNFNKVTVNDLQKDRITNRQMRKCFITKNVKRCINDSKNRFSKRFRRPSSNETTSESLEMSSHSDSDVLETISDFYSDLDTNRSEATIEKQNSNELSREEEIEKIIKDLYETDEKENYVETNIQQESNIEEKIKKDKVTVLSSIRLSPYNRAFYFKPSDKMKRIEKTFDIFNQTKSCSAIGIEHPKILQSYNIGDTVLTRYYTRQIWKYYVGKIEKTNVDPKTYTVSYYKAIGKNDNVKFIIPKRKDIDCLPESNIVKKIELIQRQKEKAEYTLMDNADIIYF